MKNVFFALLVFFAVILIGSPIAAIFFALYENLSHFTAGFEISSISGLAFLRGIIFSLPAICTLASLMSVLYTIRHPSKSIFLPIFHFILNFAFFLLVFPKCIDLADFLDERAPKDFSLQNIPPSLDTFRRENGGITFFTAVQQNSQGILTADGIFIGQRPNYFVSGDFSIGSGIEIDSENQSNIIEENVNSKKTRANLNSTPARVFVFNDSEYVRDPNQIFADSIIENAISFPFVVEFPCALYKKILQSARSAHHDGFLCYLSFCSIAFAFCASYGLKSLSSWKLLNACYCVASYFLILIFNGLCRLPEGFLAKISQIVNQKWILMIDSLSPIFSPLKSLCEPFIFFANTFFALFLCAISVILLIFRRKNKNPFANGEDL